MKISDDRLNGIIDKMQIRYQNAPELGRNFEKDVHDCLLELQSFRKIDIPGTLKYAEESATAFEELKHGIKEAIKELENKFTNEIDHGIFVSLFSKYIKPIIGKHVSKYIDFEG